MSCDTGSRSVAGGPAGGSGISNLASKAAHFAGKTAAITAGAGLGGAAGAGLGSLVAGPVGTVAGGAAGGVVGGIMANKRYERRQAEARERKWRQSPAGQKAVAQYDKTAGKLKTDYQAKVDKFKAQQRQITDDHQQAKTAWLAEKLPEKEVRKKAVAGSLAAGSVALAVETLAAGKITGTGAGWSALASVVTYPEQVERLKNAEWKKSPQGRKADAQYIRRMDSLKTRWRQAKGDYETQKAAAESKYEIARAKALA